MRFPGRAVILVLSSLFLVSTAFADGNGPDRNGKASEPIAAAGNDSAANPAAENSNDAAAQPVATASVATPANDGAAPTPAAATKPSGRGDGGEQAPRWNPMLALDGNPGPFTLETGDILPKGGFNFAFSV